DFPPNSLLTRGGGGTLMATASRMAMNNADPLAFLASVNAPTATIDPLTCWNTMRVTCSQIQVQGNPSTLMAAGGARRRATALAAVTPDVAYANPAAVLGKDVTWSGTLRRLRAQDGETHLV